MGIVVRPTAGSDVPAIESLCHLLYKTDPGVSALLDTALLCVTAVESDEDAVVGFLCLDDKPCERSASRDANGASPSWLMDVPSATNSPTSTAFVRLCAVLPQHEPEASTALLRGALAVAPAMLRFLLACNQDLMVADPGLASLFTKVLSSSHGLLYEAKREEVLPALTIRPACIEDHDDMLPVLERAAVRFPALAKLPESSNPEEAFALTRVVSGQDTHNYVLVAHEAVPMAQLAAAPAAGDEKSPARLVGFMVITSEVDTSALLDTFDLHPYDNFLPAEEYDKQYEQARESMRTKKTNTLMAKLGDRVKKSASRGEQVEGEGGAQQPGSDSVSEGVQATEGFGGIEGADGADDEGIDITAAAEPSDEETKAEMAAMFGDETAEAEPTIFAITMACIDEGYESQALDFISKAFEAFPDKLYCVVTLPHDSPEPAMVSHFTRLAPLPGSLFPEVLYLVNRHALTEGFDVRLGRPEDAEGVSLLVSGMANAEDIKELFAAAQERGTAVVAAVQGEVVGLATISPKVDVGLLETNFSVSDLLYLPHHPPGKHGEIDMFCINPIFAHRSRELLSGVHRLLDKSALYYALPPGQSPPDMLDILVQVPPRHRPVAEGMEAEFALYLFSRRSASSTRRGVNAQIVVVGASEAGLAAVERLLLDPILSFNYITLLAPGGISVGGPACQYTAAVIAKLGLDARVTLLDAEVVGLDREGRVIELSDGSQLAYDVMLVACGMQEQTCNTFAETDLEVAGAIITSLELAADFSIGDATAMERIVVYGNTLEAYHALSVLEARGAAEKMQFIAPPSEESADPMVRVLRECAKMMKLLLPKPSLAVLKTLNSVPGDTRPVAVFEGADGVDKDQLDLLVGCQPHQVSRIMFLCLNNAGIVYDGRIVVDSAFRTSDPHIYAAGTAARLSRRFGHNVHFQHYNSKEVGTALGDSVALSFMQAGAVGTQRDTANGRGSLSLGSGPSKVVCCPTPGGLTFEFAGCPLAMAQPSLDAPPGGRELHTLTDRGFMQIILDANQCIHSIAYLGKVAVPVHKLSNLVGLHVAYLNNLVSKFEEGKIKDLTSYLASEAIDLLYHDQFTKFRSDVLGSSIEAVVGGTAPPAVLAGAQEATLEFVRSHINELPAFMLPTPV